MKKQKLIGSIAFLILTLIFIVVNYISNKPVSYKEEDIFIDKVQQQKEVVNNKKNIIVEIKGEVKNPDVYRMPEGAIIKDLILEAGNITSNGDLSKVNQAKKLRDGDCIIIYSKDSAVNLNIGNSSSLASEEGKINANTATKEELMKVPGIGEVTANRIIEYREANGNFKVIEDLKKVGRIGDKTLEKFKEKLEVR